MAYKLHDSCVETLETLRLSNNPLSGLLIYAVLTFVDYTPIDFGILKNGAYRTASEQRKIFDKIPKVTDCDGHVKRSKHQSGLAVDLVPWVNDAYTWDERHTSVISGAFLAHCKHLGLNVRSGSDWDRDGDFKESFYDPCHFEIIGLLGVESDRY